MDNLAAPVKGWFTVSTMTHMYTPDQIETVHIRLRQLREARQLTLIEVERLSQGAISAVALGSYERGDRKINVAKLIEIAKLYQMPTSEFFGKKNSRVDPKRITIDIRAIIKSEEPKAVLVIKVLREIAQRRGDWNGEVISLRSSDLDNLSIFTRLTVDEVRSIVEEFSFSRSK